MKPEEKIKLYARITAIEYLVTQLLYMVASAKGDPVTEIKAYAARVKEELSESTATGFDPAMSDLLMQELSEAVDRLLASLIERLERE